MFKKRQSFSIFIFECLFPEGTVVYKNWIGRQSENTSDISNRWRVGGEGKELALAKLKNISLLTLLEPANNTAGATQTVNSAITQTLVVATTEACYLLTHTASAAWITSTHGQLLVPLLEMPKTLQPSQLQFLKGEEEKNAPSSCQCLHLTEPN